MSKKVSNVTLPDLDYDFLDDRVKKGEFTNIQDAIRYAVRMYRLSEEGKTVYQAERKIK